MTEPDVALTDYALFLLNAYFAWNVRSRKFPPGKLRIFLVVFFASLSLAALAGGTVHGFFLDETTLGHRFLWPLTLILAGVTASCCWTIAGSLFFSPKAQARFELTVLAAFGLYSLHVLGSTGSFLSVILFYFPAVLFWILSLGRLYIRKRGKGILHTMGGLALTLIGAVLQQLHVGLHPQYFNHNSTYHLVQGIGLWLIWKGFSVLAVKKKGVRHG